MLSNETVNIWSHLLGFLLFFLLAVNDLSSVLPASGANREDYVIYTIGLFCFQVRFFFFFFLASGADTGWRIPVLENLMTFEKVLYPHADLVMLFRHWFRHWIQRCWAIRTLLWFRALRCLMFTRISSLQSSQPSFLQKERVGSACICNFATYKF